MHTLRTTALALIAAAAMTGAALAGGSGGGSSAPSAPPQSNRVDPQAAYQAGVAALNAQNYREAIRQLRIARRELPNNGTINYALGLAYAGADESDDAQTAFERATRAEDAPAGAWLQLGLLHLQGERREQAVAQQTALTERIAACDTTCGDTRRAQLQAALDQLTQALNAPATPETPAAAPTTGWNFPSVEEGRTAYADAVGLINQDRFAEAYDALTRANAAIGPNADVLNYMGFVSRKLGRYDAALAYYNQALTIDPNHLGAIEYLGELYIQMGEMERARGQLAQLDSLCSFGCQQREELARWIARVES
jgi:tetratricopeptide (TPR) repeat protein